MDSRAKLEKHLNRSNAFLTNAAVNMTNKHDSFEKLEYLDNPYLNRFYSSLPDGFHHVSFKLFNFAEALQRVQSGHKCRQVTRHCIFDVTWGKELINSMHEIINLELLSRLSFHDCGSVKLDHWILLWQYGGIRCTTTTELG